MVRSVAIHETACVHAKAEVAAGVSIGPYSVIGEHVRIGQDSTLGPHVVIEGWTEIGADCKIFAGAILGAEPQDVKFNGGRSFVRIGEGNVIREGVTIHRSAREEGTTAIGNGNYLMAYCHIAHDCRVGNEVIITNYAGLSGHVVVEDGAIISGHVGVHQFVRIGTLAIVSGLTRVSKDVPPYLIAAGNPARIYGLNVEGLRRRHVVPAVRAHLKKAFRLVYRSGLNTTQALQRIREVLEMGPELQQFVRFIEHSERGILR